MLSGVSATISTPSTASATVTPASTRRTAGSRTSADPPSWAMPCPQHLDAGVTGSNGVPKVSPTARQRWRR